MRNAWSAGRLAFVVCMLYGLARAGYGRDVPILEHRVTDLAQLLTPQEDNALEARLKAYETQTGRQFALLTVPSLDGEALEMFSIRVVEQWKLGRKGEDDGLLLVIALQDRRTRIEVGYKLEPTITDALSSQVIRHVLQPTFHAGAYSDGVSRAFAVLMAAANKEPVTGLLPQDEAQDWISPAWRFKLMYWGGILVLAVIILLILDKTNKGRKPLDPSQAPLMMGLAAVI